MKEISNHADLKYERAKNGFYATDPRAIDALFKVEDFSNNIWECAAGTGHLSKRMEELGKTVTSTDLIDRGEGYEVIDFLDKQYLTTEDIITNPPYKYATEFVYQALSIVGVGSKVAFLLRTLFVESIKRRKLFDEFPPKNIWVVSRRIGCKKGGGISWFVWEKGYTGKTTLGWI